MTRSEQDKANRLYYLKGGRCPNCGGKRPVIEGRTRCEVCAEKERQCKKRIHDRRVAEGVCVKCGRPRDDERYKTCSRCRNKDVFYKRNDKVRYDQRKESGMCVDCGERAALAGHILCNRCRNKRKVNNRKNDPGWAKKYERRQQLILAGLCIDCSKPTLNGKQRCPTCIEARRDSTRKYQIKQRIQREADEARRRSII